MTDLAQRRLYQNPVFPYLNSVHWRYHIKPV